jgi:hypothetical protein
MNDESLEKLLRDNLEEQKNLLSEFKSSRIKTRDFWDHLGTISAILVAIIGGIFTLIYSQHQNEVQKYQAEIQKSVQEQQNRILEVQVVEKFLPHLSSDNESIKKAAIIALGELGNIEIATRLAALFNSIGTRDGVDALMTSSTTNYQTQLPSGAGDKPSAAKTDELWIYLGEYSMADARWIKRYLDFDNNTIPNNLINQTLKVRKETGALNVRKSCLGEVVDGLEPESSVKILEIKNYAGIGYMWARVKY